MLFFQIFQRPYNLISILDLGGQKNERRKWVHNFDNLEGIIFMAALSDYDMFTFDNKNRLMESLKLFKIVMEWFRYNLILDVNNNNFLVTSIVKHKGLAFEK